ncbi:MAG: hypothetical protein ABIJ34_01365 [archaeon]
MAHPLYNQIHATYLSVHELSGQVAAAALAASLESGHMPHEVMKGFVQPVLLMDTSFGYLDKILGSPYVGPGVSPFHPYEGWNVLTGIAHLVASKLDMQLLESINSATDSILEKELTKSVQYFIAQMESGKAGQIMIAEDRKILEPVIDTCTLLSMYHEFSKSVLPKLTEYMKTAYSVEHNQFVAPQISSVHEFGMFLIGKIIVDPLVYHYQRRWISKLIRDKLASGNVKVVQWDPSESLAL